MQAMTILVLVRSQEMAANAKPLRAKPAIAKITSKGQITIPAETRRVLGVKPGDWLTFEHTATGDTFVRKADEFPFDRFRGMGTGVPELEAGPDSILRYLRELRDHDEFDHFD
jgi:AbrB family looped-hinge helix DNA binding protein